MRFDNRVKTKEIHHYYFIISVIDFSSKKYTCSTGHKALGTCGMNSMRVRRVKFELATSWFENQVPSL